MIKQICGFLDDAGQFHKTEKEVYFANEVIKERILRQKVNSLCDNLIFRNNLHGYDIAYAMMDRPEEFLSVLWEITRHNFKKKMDYK